MVHHYAHHHYWVEGGPSWGWCAGLPHLVMQTLGMPLYLNKGPLLTPHSMFSRNLAHFWYREGLQWCEKKFHSRSKSSIYLSVVGVWFFWRLKKQQIVMSCQYKEKRASSMWVTAQFYDLIEWGLTFMLQVQWISMWKAGLPRETWNTSRGSTSTSERAPASALCLDQETRNQARSIHLQSAVCCTLGAYAVPLC